MMIQIEMGPDFPATVASLGAAGQSVLDAADKGMGTGVKLAASTVASEYLTGQSLKRRTGHLARHVQGWLAGPLHGVVGVSEPSTVDRYKWLLGDEQMTILPKKGKFLTIPIGEALTGAGVLKGEYSGGLRSIEGGFFVRSKGNLLFGYKRGKKGKFRALFVLVKSVFVQGSGALWDGVNDSLDDITASMQSEIDKVSD
jgi:hypothetical protein